MFAILLSAASLDPRAEVADRPGGQPRGLDRPHGLSWRELGDVARREGREIRAAQRRLRQDIRGRVISGEAGEDAELPADVPREIPDDLELQGARTTRPAGLFEQCGGPGSGGDRLCWRAHSGGQAGTIRRYLATTNVKTP